MKYVIRISNMGGIFVEEDAPGSKDWGEYVFRIEAENEEDVLKSAEFQKAQELSEELF